MQAPVAKGDLLVLGAEDVKRRSYLFACFHGDTDGRASRPVLDAVNQFHSTEHAASKLLLGLDANTHFPGSLGYRWQSKAASYPGIAVRSSGGQWYHRTFPTQAPLTPSCG